MPLVTAIPKGLQNGNIITEFTDTTNLSSVTYTYPTQQTSLVIENSGEKDIFVTVGGYTDQVINADKKWRVDVPFTSFSIRSNTNSQEFIATAIYKSAEDLASITSQLASLGTQKADKAEVNSLATGKADKTYTDQQIALLASGAPNGIYTTVSELQAAFPTGDNRIKLVTGNVKEVASLTVSAVPTVAGNVTVTLNGVATNIAVTDGVKEVASLTVTAIPTTAGNVTITLNGVATTVALDSVTDTTTDLVATKIRNAVYSTGAVTGGTGSTVTFTASAVGVKTDAVYSAGATSATGTMTTTTQGVDADTTTSVATKIRNTLFPNGAVTGGTGSTVTFTAASGGVKTDATYSAGSTGATGTMTTTTQGVDPDGKWYYWNGSAWTSGGIYQSTGIMDKSVTPEKTDFIDISYSANLYNPSIQTVNAITDNALIVSGVIATGYNNFLVTGKIYLKPNQEYKLSHDIWWDASAGSRGAMFDKNDNYLGNITASPFTTVAGTEYIRLSSEKSAMFTLDWLNSNFMIVEGTTLPATYVPYKKTMALVNSIGITLPPVTNDAPIYVDRTGDVINVISKYNATQDLRTVLNKKGGNNIFDFYQWFLISNTTKDVSTDIVAGTLYNQSATDWFSPHQVKAVNTINGDNLTDIHFTGGNHEYTNTGSGGTPTARTESISLFVDGRKVTDFKGNAHFIDIYIVNYVQAMNTKKLNGTGREVLRENIHRHFDGYKWEVNATIDFLEDVTWSTFYGLQCNNGNWNDGIFYHSSPKRKWYAVTSTSSDSGDKKCNQITLKKGTNYLDMGVVSDFGLGAKDFNVGGFGAFTLDYGKTYFNLVQGNTSLLAGDTISFKGFYRFYSK